MSIFITKSYQTAYQSIRTRDIVPVDCCDAMVHKDVVRMNPITNQRCCPEHALLPHQLKAAKHQAALRSGSRI